VFRLVVQVRLTFGLVEAVDRARNTRDVDAIAVHSGRAADALGIGADPRRSVEVVWVDGAGREVHADQSTASIGLSVAVILLIYHTGV
jgi:hypothetical protein